MSRLEIVKTYKLFIGGQFPRTESGRFYTPMDQNGKALANMCLASKKDVRNAVVAARKAAGAWSERSAFNRGQIMYRIAEILEGRRTQFIEEICAQGKSRIEAEQEVNLSIDRIVYYAGWCDKYQAIVSSVNPVASSHFNFSMAEPMGVVGLIAPSDTSLIGLVSLLMPLICGGNTVVVLASEKLPLCAITFSEVLHSSDVPGGVVNVLTGSTAELQPTLSSHMDVNAVVVGGNTSVLLTAIQEDAALNVKRVFQYDQNWMDEAQQGLHYISDTQEIKTTWHTIEHVGGATSSY